MTSNVFILTKGRTEALSVTRSTTQVPAGSRLRSLSCGGLGRLRGRRLRCLLGFRLPRSRHDACNLKAANDNQAVALKAANENTALLRKEFEAYKAAHP